MNFKKYKWKARLLGILKNNKNYKPLNLSLFSDYKPQTTTHGLVFKDKEKALHTINL